MTDFARDVAAEVRPPEFDTLVRRAERRRVRRRVSRVVAAAVVVTVTAVGAAALRSSDDATPLPTNPSPTVSSSATSSPSGEQRTDPRSTVARGTLTQYAVDGHGDLLTKWQACQPPPNDGQCSYAVKFESPDRSTLLEPGRFENTLLGGPDGFVRASWNGENSIMTGSHPDGFTPLLDKASGHISPGTVIVRGADKSSLRAVDPATETSWPLTADCIAHQAGWQTAVVAATGTVWAVPLPSSTQESVDLGRAGPTSVCSSTDGAHWHVAFAVPYDPQTMPAVVTASGRHVALVMTGTGSATVTPVTAIWTTDDAAHWAKLSGVPFDTMDSIAATSSGTLFVASGNGDLYRSSDWRTFAKVGDARVSNLQPNGATVAGQLSPGFGDLAADPRLSTISDSGAITPWPTPVR